jgi:integrase
MTANNELIRANAIHMRLQGRSEVYIRERSRNLTRLARAIPVPLDQASHDHILAWRSSLTVSPASTVSYVSHIREFYAWARDTARIIDDSPAASIPVPVRSRGLPRPIPEAALIDVLAAAPRRIRAWIVLAGWAALRCQEIALLRGENIRLDAMPPYILVTRDTAKGRRERAVQLGDFAVRELAGARIPRKGWAFTRRDGQPGPNTPARVSELINNLLRDCGYADTAHSLRHRCLTEVQRIGKDLRITQQIAGHASPADTAVYTLVANSAAQAVMQSLPVPTVPAA